MVTPPVQLTVAACMAGKAKPLMTKSYELFHILRYNNSAVDALANMGASLPQGHYSLNENAAITKFIP